jgi:ubiquinone/menaquinone biosynthesis C-methylase UbiE
MNIDAPGLPEYARRLDLLHQSLAREFRELVGSVPLRGDETVVDAGCGDGFFTELVAEKLPAGQTIALDADPAFLRAAGQRLHAAMAGGRCRLLEGDVLRMPMDDRSVDVVWSFHSMQSYDDIPAVLAEFHRVLRPGGRLIILESDALHSIMLPWPPRLELEVRYAERQTLGTADDRLGAYFPRYASRLLREAGFEPPSIEHRLIHRPGPLETGLREYVGLYLDDLAEKVATQVDEPTYRALREFAAAYREPHADRSFSSLQVLYAAARGR